MPINDPHLNYYEVILDGRDATNSGDVNYTKLDFPVFELAGKLKLEEISHMKVLEVMIPFTYYVVNASNESMNLNDASVNQSFTLVHGTYTPGGIVTELTAKLNAQGSLSTYGVTYDSNSLSLSIFNNSVPNSAFSITFSSLLLPTDNLFTILGFPAGAQTSQTHEPAGRGNVLLGTVTQLLGGNYYHLNSHEIGNQTDTFLPRGSEFFGNGGPQLATIPRTQHVFGEPSHWQDPSPEEWFDFQNLQTLTKMDLFITDNRNTILKFNGDSFMVKLGVLLNDASKHKHVEGLTTKKLKVGKRASHGH